jgi:hypothetical protein
MGAWEVEMRRSNGSLTPVKKVQAVGIGGGLATVFVWAIHEWGKITVPPEVAAAFAALIGSLAGYITPAGEEE